MSSTEPAADASVTAEMAMTIGTRRLRAKMTVPAGPTSLLTLLPLVQILANAVVDAAVEDAVAAGASISCKKGCGACCRQLVPISQVEARSVRDLVEQMPEPRRTQIRARFADARKRLHESGLLAKLVSREQWAPEAVEQLGIDYFQQGIPCPFLEDESCSIHPDRPITCREYLVTTPAEHCARPTRTTVDTVRIPLKVWPALARFDRLPQGEKFIRWVPLILAPEWSENVPDQAAPRPGPELLKELFENLTGQHVPPPPVGLGARPAQG